MQVIVEGRLAAYEQNSTYQIIASAIIPLGTENLERDREERWRRLEKEGLFGGKRKITIPYMPEYIGVVCSRTSAAFKDIERWLRDFYPSRYELLVKSVKVQGEGAAGEICAAIEGMSRELPRPEVIIVARGGGAEEDLSAFDDEDVVRAAAYSEIPIITGIGHESDRTLIDFAADLRAPTPTAAAAILQLEDRRNTGVEFSSESEPEPEGVVQEDVNVDWPRRLAEMDERLEDIRKLAHETKDRMDELEVEAKKPRSRKVRTFSIIVTFVVFIFFILVAVLWPILDTWAEWPDVCSRYIGWAPLCE